eukprot:6501074-Lingulodinium_polyedra.AAC.1
MQTVAGSPVRGRSPASAPTPASLSRRGGHMGRRRVLHLNATSKAVAGGVFLPQQSDPVHRVDAR